MQSQKYSIEKQKEYIEFLIKSQKSLNESKVLNAFRYNSVPYENGRLFIRCYFPQSSPLYSLDANIQETQLVSKYNQDQWAKSLLESNDTTFFKISKYIDDKSWFNPYEYEFLHNKEFQYTNKCIILTLSDKIMKRFEITDQTSTNEASTNEASNDEIEMLKKQLLQFDKESEKSNKLELSEEERVKMIECYFELTHDQNITHEKMDLLHTYIKHAIMDGDRNFNFSKTHYDKFTIDLGVNYIKIYENVCLPVGWIGSETVNCSSISIKFCK